MTGPTNERIEGHAKIPLSIVEMSLFQICQDTVENKNVKTPSGYLCNSEILAFKSVPTSIFFLQKPRQLETQEWAEPE